MCSALLSHSVLNSHVLDVILLSQCVSLHLISATLTLCAHVCPLYCFCFVTLHSVNFWNFTIYSIDIVIKNYFDCVGRHEPYAVVFRWLSWKVISPIAIDRPFHSLSVMFVHCAQKAEDIDRISFAYDSLVSLPNRVHIWLTPVDLFNPKFCPNVTQPFVDLSIWDIRWEIVSNV